MSQIEDREKLHRAELDILIYFIYLCNKNNFQYFMMGGSLLGTISHGGFIPWDDDIDVGMPREDCDSLVELLIKKTNSDFPFKNFNNSNIKTYFSRIENPKVKIEDLSANKFDIRNAWLDIFPLDGMPDGVFQRNIHKIKLLWTRILLQYSQFDEIVNVNLTERPWYENLLIDLGKVVHPDRFLDKQKLTKRLDKQLHKYNYSSSKFVVNFMGAYKFREMFPISFYQNTGFYNFSGITVVCSNNFDDILKQMYGSEYMQPPSNQIKNKHFSRTIND